jgi:hypothetical protein
MARRHVERYLTELADHLDDLRAGEESAGRRGKAAEIAALERLGTTDNLTHAMLARPELRAWSARAPSSQEN